MAQLEHYQVVHKRVLFLTLVTENRPRVTVAERVEKTDLGQGFHRVISRQGFMEHRNMEEIFGQLQSRGHMDIDMTGTNFIMGQTNITPDGFRMNAVRAALFGFIKRNTLHITDFIKVPSTQVVELGVFVDL